MKNSLLFGNGLNLLAGNGFDWNKLLTELKGDKVFENGKLPNTMIYERIFLERGKTSLDDEIYLKQQVAKKMINIVGNKFYEELVKLDFENYMTTNYDYALKDTFIREGIKEDINSNTEKIYNIRRYRSFIKDNKQIKIWHLHGELDNPKSIQLGLDHYCGYVSKIDAYVKGHYEYQDNGKDEKVDSMSDKLRKNKFDNTSWIDLFFNTNVHIIGLSLDYSETDLWWVLNKRARMIMKHGVRNKILFYTEKIDEEKSGLLKALKVDVVITRIDTFDKQNIDYEKSFYNCIDKIKQSY